MENNPFFEKPKPKKKNLFIVILEILVVITSLAIVLYVTVLSTNQVDGPSMEPNFFTNQLYFANKLAVSLDGTPVGNLLGFGLHRGDVIVLQLPGHPPYIKRIIGLPGDTVSVRDGYTFVNGNRLIESYLPPARYTKGGNFVTDNGQGITVPNGYYIAFGDNRPVSNDSRYEDVGLIKKEWIIGRVFLRFWPLNNFGIIRTGKSQLLDPSISVPTLINSSNDSAVCRGDCLLNDLGQCPITTVGKNDVSCPAPPAVRCCPT